MRRVRTSSVGDGIIASQPRDVGGKTLVAELLAAVEAEGVAAGLERLRVAAVAAEFVHDAGHVVLAAVGAAGALDERQPPGPERPLVRLAVDLARGRHEPSGLV